jgi:hypothetical protein
MYKFKGQLIEKSEIQNVGKTTKLEFIIKDSTTQWENYAKFDIFGDHIQKLKYVDINEEIEVLFNIKGRQYNGKVYTNLVACNINTDYNNKVETTKVSNNNLNNHNPPF